MKHEASFRGTFGGWFYTRRGYCSPPRFTADPVIGRTHPGWLGRVGSGIGEIGSKEVSIVMFLYFKKPTQRVYLASAFYMFYAIARYMFVVVILSSCVATAIYDV